MKIKSTKNHESSIWIWNSQEKGGKVSLWLPYAESLLRIPRSSFWEARYGEETLEIDLQKTDLIMLYGERGNLPVTFLADLSKYGIPLMIHERRQPRPFIFYPPDFQDRNDILSLQILARNNKTRRKSVAKALVKARIASMSKRYLIPEKISNGLHFANSIQEIRLAEAQATARYWSSWYSALGQPSERRINTPLNHALNLGSAFLHGILLRWILFHHLSPMHGFLHEATSYSALVYDLMEPYRYILEDAAADVFRETEGEEKAMLRKIGPTIKERLSEIVFVPATRQSVQRKNLLHGIVLALRAWLAGDSPKFIIPTEGEPRGGRKPLPGYILPGGRLSTRKGVSKRAPARKDVRQRNAIP
ncbi:CRISPR-associated endonuclease Cas1 [Mesosutterella sp. AGMB02718]|uniref:CRISPR-associated endonuclease Cas1 n=1 Tax=Mesosutterella faecium TaxID=2925194 RepID=A0ABT7IPW8_9BURK|nr:CRISPR-associated endonuclease Cas1 [Mesosutterella sp. AGMB02718]MDL2060428.1 CRISPR-associated endonuclease Cas1 [Mesosutterella sp. AGMB02718]